MSLSIPAILRPPHFDDEKANERATILWTMLVTLLAIVVLYLLIAPTFFFPESRSILPASLLEIAVIVGMLALARRGYIRLTSWLLCLLLELLLLFTLYQSGGIRGAGYLSHISLVLVVGLLLGGRQATGAALVSLLAGLLAWYITASGLSPNSIFQPSIFHTWSEVTLNIVTTAIFLRVWDRSSQRARQRIHYQLAERQRAEAALAHSEEELHLALSASRVGTWNWNITTGDVTWSEQVGLLFGLPPGESVGSFERYLSLIHPEDRPLVETAIQAAVAERSQMSVEHRVIWPDNSIHWLVGRGDLATGTDDSPVRMAGTVVDITDRKRTSLELAESERKYRLLFETSQDAIVNLELEERRIVDCNPATEAMYGYSRKELLGMTSMQLSQNPPLPLAELDDSQFSSPSKIHRQHAIHQRKDGSTFPVEVSASAYQNNGKPMIYAAFRDITERMEAESALRSSEARYRAIVESTDDLICRFLPDTTLIFVNEAYCRYFGRTREELIGLPFLTLIPESEHASIREQLQKLMETDASFTYEHQVVTPGGELRWQQWTDRSIVDGDGVVRELQSVGRDTNERRVTEEHLQESLREKEILFREIHHRVKNNLQIVSSLLKLQAATLEDSQMRAIVDDSRNRINSMALIHERLYRTGDLAQIDFAAYAKELVVHLFRAHGAAARHITAHIDIPDIQLRVDTAIPCGLIINELVTNALKHAFPHQTPGQVTIAVTADRDERVHLRVQDNGIGLPPGQDIAETDSLGLQLVQTLVAQIDGALTRLPGPGAGICITFSNKEKLG
ncbi:MAG: PAS domain S-box protein [Caldilineaceae bacterium]|nr:PAS domain S-box protein [Caldilineaceae bacterium]